MEVVTSVGLYILKRTAVVILFKASCALVSVTDCLHAGRDSRALGKLDAIAREIRVHGIERRCTSNYGCR